MRKFGFIFLLSTVTWMMACGGNGSSNNGGGGGSNPPPVTNNVQPIVVDAGPLPQSFLDANVAFTTVTVCVPGTSTCQSIDHIQVDTGSQGLRLVSGVLTITLPRQTLSNGDALDSCLPFADGYVWGPVAKADIKMAGEVASSAPVQVMIPDTDSPPVPTACSDQNPPGGNGNEGDVATLGANGIIGIGLFEQDCGLACTSQNSVIPDRYFDCDSSGNCTHTYVTLAQQVVNPVAMFSSDNNGVILQLPSVPNGGSPTATGSMIFGVGTKSNNALGSATVYQVPDTGANAGDIITTFNGQSYQGFLDSGSNGIFFLDSATSGIPQCTGDNSSWYCPTNSPQSLTASNQGQNENGGVGNPVPVNFTIESADTLFSNNNTAYSTLSGPFPDSFDFGLSFFYGRSVFTSIENRTVPGTNVPSPFFAY